MVVIGVGAREKLQLPETHLKPLVYSPVSTTISLKNENTISEIDPSHREHIITEMTYSRQNVNKANHRYSSGKESSPKAKGTISSTITSSSTKNVRTSSSNNNSSNSNSNSNNNGNSSRYRPKKVQPDSPTSITKDHSNRGSSKRGHYVRTERDQVPSTKTKSPADISTGNFRAKTSRVRSSDGWIFPKSVSVEKDIHMSSIETLREENAMKVEVTGTFSTHSEELSCNVDSGVIEKSFPDSIPSVDSTETIEANNSDSSSFSEGQDCQRSSLMRPPNLAWLSSSSSSLPKPIDTLALKELSEEQYSTMDTTRNSSSSNSSANTVVNVTTYYPDNDQRHDANDNSIQNDKKEVTEVEVEEEDSRIVNITETSSETSTISPTKTTTTTTFSSPNIVSSLNTSSTEDISLSLSSTRNRHEEMIYNDATPTKSLENKSSSLESQSAFNASLQLAPLLMTLENKTFTGDNNEHKEEIRRSRKASLNGLDTAFSPNTELFAANSSSMESLPQSISLKPPPLSRMNLSSSQLNEIKPKSQEQIQRDVDSKIAEKIKQLRESKRNPSATNVVAADAFIS